MRLDVLNPRLLPYAVTFGFLAVGAMVGLVVATGNLVLIALVVGGAAGVVLLNALPVAVWLLLVGVLLVSGPLGYFFPGLTKASWLLSLLGVFMSGAALLYAVVGRSRPARPVPGFVPFALAFAVLALLSAIFSNGSMPEISAGLKRQFQFWGLIFLFAVVPFTSIAIRRWLLFLLGVAIVQLPVAAYQRFVLVPQVMGYEAPGFVPFDIIVGTFEGSMFGGGSSAIMAMFQVIVCLGLYCAYREKLINGLLCAFLMLLVAVPLGLGETKVVLFLIPTVLLAAFSDTIARRPLVFVGGALAALLLGALLAYLYFLVQVSGETTLQENLEETFAYNFGERGYYGTGVNRLTAVPYWFESQSWAQPLRTLFGHGVGSAYGMDGRVLLPGHVFLAHSGMHIDLVTASQILWELGAVGALLFYGTLVGALSSARRNLAEAKSAWDRTFCRSMLASLAALFLMSFYSSSIVVLLSHSFLFALTLGLVAWRARHGPMELTAKDLQRQVRSARQAARGGMRGTKFRHWEGAGAADPGAFAPVPTGAGVGQGVAARRGQTGARTAHPAAAAAAAPAADWRRPPPSRDFPAATEAAGPGPEGMFAANDEPRSAAAEGAKPAWRRPSSRRDGRIDPVIDAGDWEAGR